MNMVIEKIFKTIGAHKSKNVTYNLQCNVVVGRLNKTLLNKLMYIISNNLDQWGEPLYLALFVCRILKYSSVTSVVEILYCRKPAIMNEPDLFNRQIYSDKDFTKYTQITI